LHWGERVYDAYRHRLTKFEVVGAVLAGNDSAHTVRRSVAGLTWFHKSIVWW